MSFSTIQFHPGPRVASIVLNRPPVNVINLEMLKELHAAWDEVEGLRAQVVVISGAGAAFSAGVDIADHMPDRIGPVLKTFHGLILRLRRSDCITVAAIHGHTLGGGAELAIMCDFIIAADNSQIGQPEISVGCYPPVAAAHLPAAIGFHKASEMVLLGEPIDAAQAEKLGLVNKGLNPLPRGEVGGMLEGGPGEGRRALLLQSLDDFSPFRSRCQTRIMIELGHEADLHSRPQSQAIRGGCGSRRRKHDCHHAA